MLQTAVHRFADRHEAGRALGERLRSNHCDEGAAARQERECRFGLAA